MPRQPRIYIEGALYYIVTTGNHGEEVFKDEGDYKMYLNLLNKYQNEYGLKLFSFVLMSRQVNLLIELKEGAAISMVMRDLTSSYTKYFNKRYERKGHLFRERFKSVVVEKEPYLLSFVSYAHQKPLELGLVDNLDTYYNSSHPLYLYYAAASNIPEVEELKKQINIEKEIPEVLEMIKNIHPQNSGYAGFMAALKKEDMQGICQQLERKKIFGSEAFSAKVEAELKSRMQQKEKQQMLNPATVIFAALMLSALGVTIFYIARKTAPLSEELKKVTLPAVLDKDKAVYTRLEEGLEKSLLPQLDNTRWDLELTPGAKTEIAYSPHDALSFKENKVNSGNLAALGFSSSRYTLSTRDDGKVIWESVQSTPDGDKAFWWGEISRGKMKGILSLRYQGKTPQDFSFISKGFTKQ
jgi:REP element-mobilizing transposase RayT